MMRVTGIFINALLAKQLQIYEESVFTSKIMIWYVALFRGIGRTDVKSSCYNEIYHGRIRTTQGNSSTLYCQFIWGQSHHSSGPRITVRAFWVCFYGHCASDWLLFSTSLFGLFPDSGTIAALVEQHIGLTGLQLVFWDLSRTGIIVKTPSVFIQAASCVVAHVDCARMVTYCI